MGRVQKWECEVCKGIVADDGWLLRGQIRAINSYETDMKSPESDYLSYCRRCLAFKLDPSLKDAFEKALEAIKKQQGEVKPAENGSRVDW